MNNTYLYCYRCEFMCRTRTTTKGCRISDKLRSALVAVSEGTHIKKSAKMFEILESTLQRRMKGNNISKAMLGRCCFSVEDMRKNISQSAF